MRVARAAYTKPWPLSSGTNLTRGALYPVMGDFQNKVGNLNDGGCSCQRKEENGPIFLK